MHVNVFSAHAFEQEFLLQANQGRHQLQFIPETLSLKNAAKAMGSKAVALFTSDDASLHVLEKLHVLGVHYVALRSAGFDHVNLPKATELKMRVASVPAYSPYAIAEHAVALLLALNRKLVLAHTQIEQNNFSLDNLIGFDLHGKTVGIIGMGKIGGIVARIMHGFGCRVLVYDVVPVTAAAAPVEQVSMERLLHESDIISLHAPLNEATHYLINRATIAQMKDGVYLINTSRGGLINTEDLVEALKSGKVGAAGLDVYEKEKPLFFKDLSGQPLHDDLFETLRALPNVLITGHQGFLTQTALRNIADTTLYNLNQWDQGEASVNELNHVPL
ncbi:2-hydroxyacid dehydrogenase [Rufibacter quisquiliarum]|uniref:D-lactate dehydrogenase n=1 Tax=Rufibacter quisquiliarum TaxID=1549639 RepID=A0A839GF35_9BACT|nr:2-hydroxyacid dehydrogenase [Rufibacter quisquiliarum]MBA9077522.1 D-lactate dehydrogenase [Rufibacter quisquiliarum]